MNWFDKLYIKLTLGEVIEDYGVFSVQEYLSTHQELSLLKCNKNGKVFFVIKSYLKSVSTPLLGLKINYLKVSREELEKLYKLLAEKILV